MTFLLFLLITWFPVGYIAARCSVYALAELDDSEPKVQIWNFLTFISGWLGWILWQTCPFLTFKDRLRAHFVPYKTIRKIPVPRVSQKLLKRAFMIGEKR